MTQRRPPSAQPQTLIAIDPTALQILRDEIADEIADLRRLVIQLNKAPAKEWLTVKEYAEYVNKTPRTVRNWIDAGRVQTKMEGTVTLVRVNRAA